MILEEETFKTFGYHIKDLKPHSHKLVINKCDDCGRIRMSLFKKACRLCINCSNKGIRNGNYNKHASEEIKIKMSQAQKRSYDNGRISWMKGKKLSEEARRKISEGLKKAYEDGHVSWNKGLSEVMSGERNPMYGRHHSKETKKKISVSTMGRKLSRESINKIVESRKWYKHSEETKRKIGESHMGGLSPNWLGGKSFEPYLPEFNDKLKRNIRKRDNYTCQECGYTEEQLGYSMSIHHVDYNKKNNSENNLISLCRSCHSQTNFNRQDWERYYKKKIENVITNR